MSHALAKGGLMYLRKVSTHDIIRNLSQSLNFSACERLILSRNSLGCYVNFVFIDPLFSNVWLQDRRHKHKLTSYLKMVKGRSTYSLSSLVPQSVGSITQYSLRGSQNHRIPQCRTELYKKSVLPKVIEE